MRMSDWSSDVCSSDLSNRSIVPAPDFEARMLPQTVSTSLPRGVTRPSPVTTTRRINPSPTLFPQQNGPPASRGADRKSTRLKLQSLMRISYAVFCLKKKKPRRTTTMPRRDHFSIPLNTSQLHTRLAQQRTQTHNI